MAQTTFVLKGTLVPSMGPLATGDTSAFLASGIASEAEPPEGASGFSSSLIDVDPVFASSSRGLGSLSLAWEMVVEISSEVFLASWFSRA
jgi:hypothetical protein